MDTHIIYGIHVWGSACLHVLEKIRVLQNKAVRVISKVQHFQIYGQTPGPLPSSDPLYKNLEILKVDDVFKFHVVKFVFQCLVQETPPNFHNWFVLNNEVHQHGTTSNVEIVRENYFDTGIVTQAKVLHTRQSNLVNYGGKSIQVLGPTLWNNLPSELRNMERLNPFKYHCKNHYINPFGQVRGHTRNRNRNRNNTRNGHRSRLDNIDLNRVLVSRWDE